MSWSIQATGTPQYLARELRKISNHLGLAAEELKTRGDLATASISVSGHFDEANSNLSHSVSGTPKPPMKAKGAGGTGEETPPETKLDKQEPA